MLAQRHQDSDCSTIYGVRNVFSSGRQRTLQLWEAAVGLPAACELRLGLRPSWQHKHLASTKATDRRMVLLLVARTRLYNREEAEESLTWPALHDTTAGFRSEQMQ